VVINEPVRRDRVTGTDLLRRLGAGLPLDLFGMGVEDVGLPSPHRAVADLPQERLHGAMAARRVYLHPVRWTSLGLSLLEAMHLGMPIVALATTEVVEAVPPGAGIVSNRLDDLVDALDRLGREPEEARVMGKRARAAALASYGLGRFLEDWDRLLGEVTS
jgi:glycosyltransferase involved in cell wall biosynthesis